MMGTTIHDLNRPSSLSVQGEAQWSAIYQEEESLEKMLAESLGWCHSVAHEQQVRSLPSVGTRPYPG